MSLTSRLLGLSGDRAAPPAAAANRDNNRAPRGGASGIWYSTPGMPQIPEWDGLTALRNGYQASIYIMQPVRIIATALGSLPFRVGADPEKPGDYDKTASMASLLGPPPNGPNPVTSPRNLWIWSIVQRLIAGRMAWETVCPPGSDTPGAIWPLVAPFLHPIPSAPGTPRWFDGYQYQLPTGNIDYKPGEVFYSWRPSQVDWRQPESALMAANMPASLQIALNRYMWALAKNGLAAKKLVITPEFAEDDERRAWEEQFASEFTGYDNGGRVMHGYYEDDPAANSQGQQRPPIQVVDLAATPADAQVLEILKSVTDDLLRTWRVPMSWLGDASARTYENASQEAKNFWQGPVLEAAAEISDDVNMYLAPRFGDGNVGWFDFSDVEALKGTSIFAQIDPAAAKKAGLIVNEDWRNDVGLQPLPGDTPEADPELPAIDDSPGGSSKANFTRAAGTDTTDSPVAAGLAVKALDTGRVLMLQRSLADDNDPAGGTWEFPGGKLDTGEHPLAAAVREWQEETGCALPKGKIAGTWTSPNGVYVGYVYLIGAETDVPINCDTDDRHVLNPDDPDGDMAEVVAWWNPAHLPGMAGLRPEARVGTDWDLIAATGSADVRMATGDAQTLTCGHRAGTCTGPGPCDTAPFGTGTNWVNKAGGLPPYIRAIAHSLHRSGHSESSAIATAVATVKRWAAGEGHVTPATRARAAKALGQWEALKAKSHVTGHRDTLTEAGTPGLLLPQGSPATVITRMAGHMFVPSTADRRRCGVTGCGKPMSAKVHGLTGKRHAGGAHAPVRTGHKTAARRAALAQIHRQADTLEPAMTKAMTDLFAAQRKASVDRLNGRRGQQMLRAATPPEPPDGEPTVAASKPTPAVDAAQVYDLTHWIAKTKDALAPAFAAVRTLTADRFDAHLGRHDATSSLGGVQQALDERLQRLADTVSRTTFDQIAAVLHRGVAEGQSVAQMTALLEGVFVDAEKNRAPMIARTESLGALNQAAHVYADTAGPDVVAGREWLSAHDSRVRHTHRDADGQIRKMTEPYDVGGAPMWFPHDPAAPPSEVINCRCAQAFLTPVEYARRTQPASMAA